YGSDTIEIHQDAFRGVEKAKVLLVDDLIATGGTALASYELIQKAGGICVESCFLINLKDLNGWKKLNALCPVYSVLEF
ncbi:MAG: phosphoribosyltransferase family protein, partial [Campylobacter upsaliensis]